MIRFAAILALLTLAGCLPFQPAGDPAAFVRLSVDPPANDGADYYPAPIASTTAPAYLDQSTVWYSDADGRLNRIKNYLWAEYLPDAVHRGFTLLLARQTAFPKGFRIDLEIDRFLLLEDGSGEAVIEVVVTTDGSTTSLPIIRVDSPDLWNPDAPATFLKGYLELLEASGKQLNAAVMPLVKEK